ncbi:hypothetical protein [Cytobacillus massiliigabonensis]|uniref:hypothetical protein n=1 Tax=Cytobacillus massiliigabonensis TaxID=1871011 RepID=UPI000C82D1D5|nr:hypothetical protein [Cytobacillus massiliigabonensis]
MITYHTKKGFVRITEKIGKDPSVNQSEKVTSDLLYKFELQLSPEEVIKLVSSKNSLSLLEPTYLIDLSMDEDEILKRIHKNTRYKINRAATRDELHYVELTSPSDNQINDFKEFYNPFAREKNIRECDMTKLKALRDQEALVISYIEDSGYRILCYHVYFVAGTQGYLLYSASRRFEKDGVDNRNLIGRANRYLHWRDILSFKQKGCKWYNFGGKILNPSDKSGQNINEFKLSFGSIHAHDLRIYYSKSLKGKIFLFLLRLKLILKENPEYTYTLEIIKRNGRGFDEENI